MSSSSSPFSSSLANLPAFNANSPSEPPVSSDDSKSTPVPSFLTPEDSIVYRSAGGGVAVHSAQSFGPLDFTVPQGHSTGAKESVGGKSESHGIAKGIAEISLSAANENSLESSPPAALSVSPQPPHVELSSSFYSSSHPSNLMSAAMNFLKEKSKEGGGIKISFETTEGEAKLHGVIFPSKNDDSLSGESPVVFSLKIFQSEDPQQGEFLVEIQRRSGSIPLFSLFYSLIFGSFESAKVSPRPLDGSVRPRVVKSMAPPELPENSKISADAMDTAADTLTAMISLAPKEETVISAISLLSDLLNSPVSPWIPSTPSMEKILNAIDVALQRPFVSKSPIRHIVNFIENAVFSKGGEQWKNHLKSHDKTMKKLKGLSMFTSDGTAETAENPSALTAKQNENFLLIECREKSIKILSVMK